ncbi:DUF6191 domain-containing protein [Streptomyces sp. NPDC056632]|uniref:DUF6191 domain-containing protein n=1 Tax=Streptomyces sp. NPDC056632 TaxID=3345884 RepID=UPI00368201A9
MFNLMEELFAPGRKHTEDERQRLALTREDLGEGAPHKGPIDLASGKVVVRIPGAAPAPDTTPDTGPGTDLTAESAPAATDTTPGSGAGPGAGPGAGAGAGAGSVLAAAPAAGPETGTPEAPGRPRDEDPAQDQD